LSELEELRHRVQIMQSVIDRVDQGLLACDAQGRWLVWNSQANELMHLDEPEPDNWVQRYGVFTDETCQEPFPNDQLPLLRALRGETVDGAVLFLSRDRQYIEVSARPLLGPGGEIEGGVAYYRDITTQRQIDEEMRRLALVVNASEDAIIGVSLLGQIFSWNPGAQRTYGYSAEEALGKPVLMLAVPSRLGETCLLRAKLMSGHYIGRLETYGMRRDGRVIPVTLTVSPIYGKSGEMLGFSTISRDISQKKQTELALVSSQERLRLLSARLQWAQEEERRRISRELHDELGQLLTALRIDLAWLEERVPDELEPRMAAMGELVNTTIATVRRIATRLRPQILEDLGLASAIDWLAQQICPRQEMRYQVHNHGLPPLNPECALALFRIAQEALTNVARHASARQVAISLSHSNTEVVLEVKDDGRGVSPASLARPESLGLLGMRERAYLWGGTVDIEGSPDQGTRLCARIPLARARASGPGA